MAKRNAYNATWLGDGDPNAQIINLFGLRFIKGEATKVPANLYVEGMDPWQLIRDNPTFAVEDEEVELNEAPEPDETDALKQQLDDLGVPYRQNASAIKLRDLLDKATAPHS